MKKASRTVLLDKLHLYSVRTLLGITLAGCGLLGYQVYTYFTVVRPQRKAVWDKEREIEMALEQQEKEAELLRRQKDAEQLVG